MNEYELLVATERAVGSTSLYETHQTLIAMRAEVKQKEVTAQAQKQRLDQLKLENQQLERDYKRFNQRWKLLHRVDVMKKKIAWMHVREKQLKAKQLKEELVKADKAVAQANEEAKGDETPARRRRDDADAAKRTANDLQNAIKRKEEEARLAADKLEKDGNAVTELRERLDGLAAASQKQKAEVKQLQDKLTKVEATVESLPPVPDHSAKIQVLQQEMNNIRDQLAHLEAEKGQLADAAHNARIEHGRLAGELRQCDSLKYQRMQALVQAQRAHGLDSATDWVNRQRAADAFKGEVVGPIGLEIKVKVPDCAPYLEQAAWWQLQNFAVTHQEDANMLLAEFKRQNIRSSAVAYTGDIHAPIASNSAPYRAYGVACSLDEVYDAHPLVKHCLANLCSLDKVLVMEQHNMQAIRALMEQHHIGQVFTPQLKVSYIPSAHGGREDASIATSGLFPSRVLTGAVGADIDQRKQQLQARLAQVEASIQQLDGQVAAAQQREAPLHARLDELSGHRSQLAKETSLASTKRANLNRAYKAGQTHLAKLEARADPLAQAPGLERQIARALVAHHATLTKQIEAALKQWQLLQQHAVAELVWRELDMQAVAMQRALDSRRAAVRLLDKAARAAKQRYQLAEDEFKRAKQVAETEHPLDKATKDRFANMPNDIETLEEEVETLKQQAAELVVNDPHVVENYQLRQTEIEGLEQQVAELQDQLGAAQQEMDRLKENWLPELQRIVGLINTSFSSNFSQIGCAGEVLLGQHEDYDKFSIQIKVKFREEEELQLLTAQRQSGGERSVSTILYLIALQGVTVTPFRVVDEINQGMDPVNERKVFTQLVEASCKEGTPQCFLLTPKLLPDLPFTEVCVCRAKRNGPVVLTAETLARLVPWLLPTDMSIISWCFFALRQHQHGSLLYNQVALAGLCWAPGIFGY
eukprot:GHRR01033413.1.p1 GENE.GHRR01033413.1~~GHRR01033413.1.p1  ORF type:complete len:1070 (+),score=417.49 GHRR01033413.1:424-3210(+)